MHARPRQRCSKWQKQLPMPPSPQDWCRPPPILRNKLANWLSPQAPNPLTCSTGTKKQAAQKTPSEARPSNPCRTRGPLEQTTAHLTSHWIGTGHALARPAFCGCAVWNTQRSDRLCLPMSPQRNLSHDMETYSSSTCVRGCACEHTRICAAPQTQPLLLPRWASLLFEPVRAGRWHAYPRGSMEPLM